MVLGGAGKRGGRIGKGRVERADGGVSGGGQG